MYIYDHKLFFFFIFSITWVDRIILAKQPSTVVYYCYQMFIKIFPGLNNVTE